jgi:[glutamine synthetase] adenylyltransferase / [glutamine synthetase]-adenylyl-L-tyrosine phosphorylase
MAALERLVAEDRLDERDAEILGAAFRFCERTRNRWFLVKGGRGDSLPTQADQLARLARSLDTTAVELREEYRRVTRRSRAVVERLFYGKDER